MSGTPLYSPLLQAAQSETESEEEIHVVSLNQTGHSHNRIHSNGIKMCDYRPLTLQTTHPITEQTMSGLNNNDPNCADDIPIFKPDDVAGDTSNRSRQPPMTPSQRILFFGSIVFCVFFVVGFLWIIPCNWDTCPVPTQVPTFKAWEVSLDLELKGPISLVPSPNGGRIRNLVFMYKAALITNNDENPNDGGQVGAGGIISLLGATGAVAWFTRLGQEPRDLDCGLADLNKDQIDDCIILGGEGLLAAVDPIIGTLIWVQHNHNSSRPAAVEMAFPLILPDLDGDGVVELATSTKVLEPLEPEAISADHNHLIIISGAMGGVIGHGPYKVPECVRVDDLAFDGQQIVSYTCHNASGRESTKDMKLDKFYKMVTGEAVPKSALSSSTKLSRQHQTPLLSAEGSKQPLPIWFETGQRRLTLENTGSGEACPHDCTTRIWVTEGNETVWNFTSERTHGMVPAILRFPDMHNSRHDITGFVLKLWQWNQNTAVGGMDHVPYLRNPRSIPASPSPPPPLAPIPMAHSSGSSSPSSRPLTRTPVDERIILVTFNGSQRHIVNASQAVIIQLCLAKTPMRHQHECQPMIENHEQSLLLDDIDQDGSLELITYLTTYEAKEGEASGWRLFSKVRIICLQTELPQLYEAVNRN